MKILWLEMGRWGRGRGRRGLLRIRGWIFRDGLEDLFLLLEVASVAVEMEVGGGGDERLLVRYDRTICLGRWEAGFWGFFV